MQPVVSLLNIDNTLLLLITAERLCLQVHYTFTSCKKDLIYTACSHKTADVTVNKYKRKINKHFESQTTSKLHWQIALEMAVY